MRSVALFAFAALPSLAATCTYSFVYTPGVPVPAPSLGGTYSVDVTDKTGTNTCAWTVVSQSGSAVSFSAPGGTGTGSVQMTIAPNTGAGRTLNWTIAGIPQTVVQSSPGMAFYPVTPCRIVDTRPAYGKPFPYGAPALTSAADRDIPIAGAGAQHCNIPSTAKAVSINVGLVPSAPVGYLSAWPTGQPWPRVSTVSSPDATNIANAAIIAIGDGGAITLRAATPSTDVTIDVDGYFDTPSGPDLTLYSITPCRAVDTRVGRRPPGPFGPPALAGFTERNFSLPQSGCAIPTFASAFVLNVTALPQNGYLGYLSIWPEGLTFPGVATLESPTGRNIANMAIVPAGTPDQGITAKATDLTDVTFDVNGYFAPNDSTVKALHYYPITPCRVVDTRPAYAFPAVFGEPALGFRQTRDFPLQAGACSLPANVKAYALNVTVIPQEASLDYLSMWSADVAGPPTTALLVSPGGLTISNATIVPAGSGVGAPVRVFASNSTHLVIDVNGYFAP